MSAQDDCSTNTDPLKLVREGTAQNERSPNALNPSSAPVNEHGPAQNMVFAKTYAAYLKYFDNTNTATDDWSNFFGSDVSAELAVPAIEDVDEYKSTLQEWFGYLNELENKNRESELRQRFGYLYASVASLAQQLDGLKKSLPDVIALKGTLKNLIKTQLAPAFGHLIAYYKAGNALITDAAPPKFQILSRPVVSFGAVLSTGLSEDWFNKAKDWATYVESIRKDTSVYGDGADVFSQINHCSTHALFKSVFDQFLKVFAGVVSGATAALEDSFTKDNTHEPHYTLFLAFLRLLEYQRSSGNTLTQKHLDFYYRTILGLKEKSSQPGHVHLLAELAKQVPSREFKAGETFRAGKDDQGKDAFFANETDFVANQAKIAARRTLYRHTDEEVIDKTLQDPKIHKGRLFASPVADSDDGLGAPLTSPDGSWHPFVHKEYEDGQLSKIMMPEAEVGFAIASHYLLMAEGDRSIFAFITVDGYAGPYAGPYAYEDWEQVDLANDIHFLVTTEKGWLEIQAAYFIPLSSTALSTGFLLGLRVDGSKPPIVPYAAKTHGYSFQTNLPMLLVKLKQDDARPYVYSKFQDVVVSKIQLDIGVTGLRSLAASNDFGPLDTSKPFQPFGASPKEGSSFIFGSKEIFQKHLSLLNITWNWQGTPTAYSVGVPSVATDVLSAGQWTQAGTGSVPVTYERYDLFSTDLDQVVFDEPDFTPNAFFNTQSRYGFVRLRLSGDFGQDKYQDDLKNYLSKETTDYPGTPPTGPIGSELLASYGSDITVLLNTLAEDNYKSRKIQFFHLAPFGTAEQHPYLFQDGGAVYLFPQFEFTRGNDTLASEAELYMGVSGLVPPQNLSLLFQVADGTANPLVEKPRRHLDWSYLSKNRWIEFGANDVQDATDGLINSGIVVLPIPREATNDNALMGAGMHWIRVAVSEKSDAVCRLRRVAAQAMKAALADRGNSPTVSALPVAAGTITKLEFPDAAVKSIVQPFPSFGGRGAEQSHTFYTRVSERLRHKNRGIELWDYERLILEAFPQIYKVKCLNHTRFEPSESGDGVYRELAPGYVTVVTVPNLQVQKQIDPLKPYTSLGTLDEIKKFLDARTSCFATVQVRNPQFEEVRVSFSVALYPGKDESASKTALLQAITQFLSPWAFTLQGAPSFGGKVYKSVLINFVEDQDCVDYVTDFQLFHDLPHQPPSTEDLDEVEASRAVSILVSTPAKAHVINVLHTAEMAAFGESCLCES